MRAAAEAGALPEEVETAGADEAKPGWIDGGGTKAVPGAAPFSTFWKYTSQLLCTLEIEKGINYKI